MTALTLPAMLPVRSLLEDLLGREVTVGHADPVMADELPTTTMAIYIGNGMQMAAVLGLDLRLAAYAGAALGLMPPGGAEDSIEGKQLTPMLAENVHELCNILTGLLNRGGAPHVKLHQVWLPGQEQAPKDAAALLLALGRRLDVHVEIARYGGGRLSLSLAP
jgi:hypothetical protein